jgi:hypothetical protein
MAGSRAHGFSRDQWLVDILHSWRLRELVGAQGQRASNFWRSERGFRGQGWSCTCTIPGFVDQLRRYSLPYLSLLPSLTISTQLCDDVFIARHCPQHSHTKLHRKYRMLILLAHINSYTVHILCKPELPSLPTLNIPKCPALILPTQSRRVHVENILRALSWTEEAIKCIYKLS